MLRCQFLCHVLKALFFIKIAPKLSYICRKCKICERWGLRPQIPVPPAAGSFAPRQWRIQKILVGGDLKHKTSKIRMSSPKLRLIFRPKPEIQTFFSPKFRWSPKKKKKKKKKKVFTKIETDFSPDSLRLGRWGGMHPEMEPIYSKQRLIFRPKSLLLGWWGGMHPPHPPP